MTVYTYYLVFAQLLMAWQDTPGNLLADQHVEGKKKKSCLEYSLCY